MALAEIVGIIKDIVLAGAAFSGASVAWLGLSTWRRQLVGGVQLDIARRVLTAAFRFRDQLASSRFPAVTSGEQESAMRELFPDEPKPKHQLERDWSDKSSSAVTQVRFKRVSERYSELEAILVEAEAVWGEDGRELRERLWTIMRDYRTAIRQYMNSLNSPENFDNEKMREIRSVVFGPFTETSKTGFDRLIHDQMDFAEGMCRRYMNSATTRLFSFSWLFQRQSVNTDEKSGI